MTDSLIPAYAADAVPVLRVESRVLDPTEFSPSDSLLDAFPPGLATAEPLVWLRGGQGLVGWGSAWRFDVAGSPFVAADDAWRAVVDRAQVFDPVRVPGSGLVAFGSFAFDPRSPAGSALIVPKVLVGRRNGTSWLTTVEVIADGDCERRDRPSRVVSTLREPQVVSTSSTTGVQEGSTTGDMISSLGAPEGGPSSTTESTREHWHDIVSQALAMLDAERDGLRKVVLARAEEVPVDGPILATDVLRNLADTYPSTWTFAVDGLIGATPELLVRTIGGEVQSRVLAGTRKRGDDDAATLLANPKEVTEHRIAVESVIAALTPFCDALDHAETPDVLELPNVWHLATDIIGHLIPIHGRRTTERNGSAARRISVEKEVRPSVLKLLSALHPTAAVCGSPRSAALAAIRELEDFDRGRYAGPVGWVDGGGDGEWGIALRCGDLGAPNPRIYAGCGIVPGSNPAAEWAESEAKLLPMRQALSNLEP